MHWALKLFLWISGLFLAGVASVLLGVAIAMAVAFPNLPDISDLSVYRPKLPLRVFSAEGTLIGEFGEERRHLTPIQEIPKVMKDAVLAIEDSRFYEHGGVDYKGILRAALANLGRIKSQGASTITMQVARNVYLSSEKTYTRKIYEILLTFKLEHMLTKDQILEVYMNQIFLGNRAYGFAAAAEAYFGKSLKTITVAEAAMLAGLPKAPSAYNPINNPKRARSRQLYIIERMLENGYITGDQADAAKLEELKVKSNSNNTGVHAEYVAETVRQLMFAQYGDATYTRGLNVYTTLRAADQAVAYRALRRGIMNFERRQIYRGPEKFVSLPGTQQELEDVIDDGFGYADAGVRQREFDQCRGARLPPQRRAKDDAARVGELERIGEEAGHDLLYPPFIPHESVGNFVRNVQPERQALLRDAQTLRSDDLGQALAQTEIGRLQNHVFRFELRHVENIVDQRQKATARHFDCRERLLLLA